MSNIITTKTQFEAELSRLIVQEIEALRDQLENPGGDFHRVQFIRGQIDTLRRMPDLMDAANKALDDRHR